MSEYIPDLSLTGGRSCSIDKLKTLAAFLVVCIHVPFPGIVGDLLSPITRIAVPVFFMISGYFYKEDKSIKHIKKVLILVCASNFIYVFWNFIVALLKHEMSQFIAVFSLSNTLRFLLFNETHFGYHLWYLSALLYVLIIRHITKPIKDIVRILIAFSPVLLIIDLVFGKYSLLIFGKEFPYYYLRNWLFTGLPFFALGQAISKNKDRVEKTSKPISILTVIVFCLLSIAERCILISINCNATRDQYITTSFLSASVFMLFLVHINDSRNKTSEIGRVHSTNIYIVHPIIIYVFHSMLIKLNLNNIILQFTLPIVVFFCAYFISLIWVNKVKPKVDIF